MATCLAIASDVQPMMKTPHSHKHIISENSTDDLLSLAVRSGASNTSNSPINNFSSPDLSEVRRHPLPSMQRLHEAHTESPSPIDDKQHITPDSNTPNPFSPNGEPIEEETTPLWSDANPFAVHTLMPGSTTLSSSTWPLLPISANNNNTQLANLNSSSPPKSPSNVNSNPNLPPNHISNAPFHNNNHSTSSFDISSDFRQNSPTNRSPLLKSNQILSCPSRINNSMHPNNEPDPHTGDDSDECSNHPSPKPFAPATSSTNSANSSATSTPNCNLSSHERGLVEVGRIDPDSDPVLQLSQLCKRHKWVYQFTPVVPALGGGYQCKCIVGTLVFPDGWGIVKDDAVRVSALQALNAISYVRGGEQDGSGGEGNASNGVSLSNSGGSGGASLNNSGGEVEAVERVRKSAYCRHFKARGWCSFGNNCRFIHGALVGLDDFSGNGNGSMVMQNGMTNGNGNGNVVNGGIGGSGISIPSGAGGNVNGGIVKGGGRREEEGMGNGSVNGIGGVVNGGIVNGGSGIGGVGGGFGELLGKIGNAYQMLEGDNVRLREENQRLWAEVEQLRTQVAQLQLRMH
eukprot:TRINITY_DN2595_c0_g2_i1.p1 TRINITY_DN2595_c0_g2~~TRINITY_DN2595_c0_g2_i1.p1  ORF type:complete len:573 (+),score=217.42 TRINITY_DN2595_c0_g2_i1:404-2122(+)